MKPEQQITTAHLVTRKHLVGRLRKAPNAKAQQHLKNSTSSSSSQSGGKSNSNSFSSNNNNNVNKKSISKQGMSSADWRRYGIEYRRQLLEQDEQEGGSKFDLNYQCRIQGYFALSEKITTQFNSSFAGECDLESTYVMGNRLVHFLAEALPRHPSYMKKDPLISRLREKSFQSLVHIQKKLEALELRIDEEQLNKYIMHDFDPFADDDDDDSCSTSSGGLRLVATSGSNSSKEDPQWESFDGWSFDLPDKLTNAGSKDHNHARFNPAFNKEMDISNETEDTSNETFSSSETSFQAADDHEPLYRGFGFEFLKRIASEKVQYETDSDADDSWAQENQSEVESINYSTTSLSQTYDPARIALKDLMLNKRQRRPRSFRSIVDAPTDELDAERQKSHKENQSLNFSLSSDTSLERGEEEEETWNAFDPNTLLPNNRNLYLDHVAL